MTNSTSRRKRESALETASHVVTVGPFRQARGAQYRSGKSQFSPICDWILKGVSHFEKSSCIHHLFTDDEQAVRRDGSDTGSSLVEKTNASTFVLAGLLIASLVVLVGVILYRNHRYRTLSQQNLLF